MLTKYKYTKEGEEKVNSFIKDCEKEREHLVKMNLDEVTDISLPTPEDILDDFYDFVDADGEYWNHWQIANDTDSSYPLMLVLGVDVIISD